MEDAYPHGNHATANNNYHLFISSLLTTRPLTSLPPQPVNDGHSWQHRLNEFLHAPILDLILHVLLIIDIICVIVAMQLSTLYLDSKVKDLERALEAADHADGDDDYRRLSGEENSEHEEYGNESFERGEHGVASLSIAILSVFLLHSGLLVLANGRSFFAHPLAVLDLCVAAVSLGFELADTEDMVVGILVLLRTWNFVRIGHGLFELEHGEEEGEDEGREGEEKEKELGVKVEWGSGDTSGGR